MESNWTESTGTSASQLDRSERLIVVRRRPPIQVTPELLLPVEPLEDDRRHHQQPIPATWQQPSSTEQQQQQQLNDDDSVQRDDDVTALTHEQQQQQQQPPTMTPSSTQIASLPPPQQQQQQQPKDADIEQKVKEPTCGNQPPQPLLTTESQTTISDQPERADKRADNVEQFHVSASEAASHSCCPDDVGHLPRDNPTRYSGDVIVELPIYSGDCCFQYPAAVDENIVPEEFAHYGISMSRDDYKQLMTSITSCFYVRCHCCFSSSCVLLFVTSVVTSYILGWSLCVACSPAAGRHCAAVEAVIAALVVVCVWAVAIAFCGIQWRRFKGILFAVNQQLASHSSDMLVACKDYGRCSRCFCNRFTIIFFYYQWQHCESHLQHFIENDFNYVHSRAVGLQQQQLSDGDTQLIVANNDDDDDDQLLLPPTTAAATSACASSDDELDRTHITQRGFTQNEASELLVRYSVEYGKLLVEERLPTPLEQRHTRHLECLCQFIQRKLIHSNN